MRNTNRFAFLPQRRELQRAPILPSLRGTQTAYADQIREKKNLPPIRRQHHHDESRLEMMKMSELKMIAKEQGISYRVGMTKQDMIDMLMGRNTSPDAPEPEAETIVVE